MIASPPVGALWGERFVLREVLAGGPGRVTYLARDRAFGIDVELWWLLPGIHRDEAADALVAGAATLRSLVHPAVRALLDAGFDEGTTWATYAVASPGLVPRVASPLPIPAAAAWARAVAAGLAAAHQVGWYHGRLVPEDAVLVEGSVRVGGLALWMMAEPVSVAAWQSHAAYLAPEVQAGWTTGPPADVWGLAAAVAALAAGTDRAIDERELLVARAPRLAAALAGALVPDTGARIDLTELLRRIDIAASGPGASVPVPSRPIVLPPPPPPAVSLLAPIEPLPRVPTPVPMAPAPEGMTYRALSELSPATVAPGEIGFVAPPRELTPPRRPRRRWVPVVGIVGGALAAAAIALVVATQTGTDQPAQPEPTHGGDPEPGAAVPGDPGAAGPRLALSPAEPAHGCTDDTLALGDLCVDPFEAPGKGRVPLTGLTARAAADACAARDLRLCTPDEWRAACAGSERAVAEQGACNLGGGVIAAAGAFERCVSATLAHDLAGNVAEWVADGTALGASALDGGDGRCDGPPRQAAADAVFSDVGYRCCGDR